MNAREVWVLIPGYNEAKNIARVVTAVKRLGFPVLVIDDGSTDGMAVQASGAGAEVLSYSPNEGKGAAIRRGIDWFLKKTQAPALIFMDSDGQHDPADLDAFLKSLSDPHNGLVVGNRMTDPKGMPWIRRATNRGMSAILSSVCGQRVPDTQCGYRGAQRDVLSKIRLETARFEIESEMVLEASRVGARVTSVPIRSVYEGGGSHIKPGRDTVRFFKFLSSYISRRKNQK